ncbi:hypothetical protein R0135_03810 [Congregibacter variabilis]|uniref:Peptidase M61 catalytic domain-containing protein n=1 Tax=Congregibacter variabilis TaxID=3081200 RepID=A0ABZ0I6U8_9GAMM|nr:hypothetical protein R0135_03810 [Congregibacter sp. IMCC43200]
MTLMLWGVPAHSALVWHWEDPFTQPEREKLGEWLDRTHAALVAYAGVLPFDVHLYMHRREGAKEPVPWANTWRNKEQALHFYVNPDFSTEAFMSDWTAPHEFAHLLLPYLGSRNAWFAEGFASYVQHSIMVELGVITPAEALARRDKKMRAAVDSLRGADRPLPDSMPSLRAEGSYPTFYWGGAVYFERVDARLQRNNQSLRAVLSDYLSCCRSQGRSLSTLMSHWDALSDSTIFSQELEVMRRVDGVPARPSL